MEKNKNNDHKKIFYNIHEISDNFPKLKDLKKARNYIMKLSPEIRK